MKPPIQSIQNSTIKQVVKLRDSGQRRKLKQFIIDGEREIVRAVAAGIEIATVYFPDQFSVRGLELEQWWLRAGLPETSLQPVSAGVMQKLAYGDRESSVVAVAQCPPLELARLRLESPTLILVLDGLEKPGNLGACMRTAAASGAEAVVLTNPVCDVFNPNAIRASRGMMFSLPIAVASPTEVIELCTRQHIRMQTARVDGKTPLWETDLVASTALVFGSEAHGLDDSWPASLCQSFYIPMSSTTDSLNVSISAALTLYEAARQRGSLGLGHRKI